MKVSELIELVKQRLAGGDVDSDVKHKFHDEVIRRYIGLALEQQVGEAQTGMLNYSDLGFTDSYIKAFQNVQVKFNEERDVYYIDLPAKPANLYQNRGVKSIAFMKSPEKQFRYMANDYTNIYFNLNSFLIGNDIRYYVEGSKCYFSDHILSYIKYNRESEKLIPNLLVKLVTFEGLDDNDNIPILAGKELPFLDLIFKIMFSSPPSDEKVDNKHKQV